ncbi:MAG: AfsR/SARP family transcriptional regulator [Chloroflexia bacterium]
MTLGSFRVYYNGEEVGKEFGLVGRPREMLAYFVTHRRDRLPLDRIAEDLWPGSGAAQAQAVFHTTLHRLRRALNRVAGPGQYIRQEGGEYLLERELFEIDVEEFDALVARIRGASGNAALRSAEMAVERYGGPYLDNLYGDWCEPERQRLAAAYLELLHFLAEHYAAAGNYPRAIWACQRILDVDPLQEPVHRDLMRYWHSLGNRSAVLHQYESLRKLLRDELQVEPLPETQQLYRELAGSLL